MRPDSKESTVDTGTFSRDSGSVQTRSLTLVNPLRCGDGHYSEEYVLCVLSQLCTLPNRFDHPHLRHLTRRLGTEWETEGDTNLGSIDALIAELKYSILLAQSGIQPASLEMYVNHAWWNGCQAELSVFRQYEHRESPYCDMARCGLLATQCFLNTRPSELASRTAGFEAFMWRWQIENLVGLTGRITNDEPEQENDQEVEREYGDQQLEQQPSQSEDSRMSDDEWSDSLLSYYFESKTSEG